MTSTTTVPPSRGPTRGPSMSPRGSPALVSGPSWPMTGTRGPVDKWNTASSPGTPWVSGDTGCPLSRWLPHGGAWLAGARGGSASEKPSSLPAGPVDTRKSCLSNRKLNLFVPGWGVAGDGGGKGENCKTIKAKNKVQKEKLSLICKSQWGLQGVGGLSCSPALTASPAPWCRWQRSWGHS